MKPVNVDQIQVFVRIRKVEIIISACFDAKNRLTKMYAIKDLFGIQPIANVNTINHVMLENVQIMRNVSEEKIQLINQLKSVPKMLKK